MARKWLQLGILVWIVSVMSPLAADPGFFDPECERRAPQAALPEINDWVPGAPCPAEDGDNLAMRGPNILPEPLDKDGRATYIVRFVEAPISRYSGGVPGLAATSARARGQQRLDLQTAEAEAYWSWLRSRQDRHHQDIELRIRREPAVEHRWQVTVNALALRLSPHEPDLFVRRRLAA